MRRRTGSPLWYVLYQAVFRLDYISCLLTIGSTILVGRRIWHGWILAVVNSLVICRIAVQTSQTGFIPANLFCLALYGYNIVKWRTDVKSPHPNKGS